MAPTDYVSDYEALTGRKPDGSPLHPDVPVAEAETKVIAAPAPKAAKKPKAAEVK